MHFSSQENDMKSRAAILFEPGQKLEIREVDVQDPAPGEVRIELAAAGVLPHRSARNDGGTSRRRCQPYSVTRAPAS